MYNFQLSGRLMPDPDALDWNKDIVLLARMDDHSNYPDVAFVLADRMEQLQAQACATFLQSHIHLVVDLDDLAGRLEPRAGAVWSVMALDPMCQWFSGVLEDGELFEWPDDVAVEREVWFGAARFVAASMGLETEPPAAPPRYDYEALRRMVFGLRARDEDPDVQLMGREFELLRRAAESHMEPGAALPRVLDEMREALEGRAPAPLDANFSVVVQTRPYFRMPQGGKLSGIWRNVVIAHGLSFDQACCVWLKVRDNPEAFVDRRCMVPDGRGGEMVLGAYIIADASLEWSAVDLTNRRNVAAFDALREKAFLRPNLFAGLHDDMKVPGAFQYGYPLLLSAGAER